MESGRTKGQWRRLEVKGINRGAVHTADTFLSVRKNNFHGVLPIQTNLEHLDLSFSEVLANPSHSQAPSSSR